MKKISILLCFWMGLAVMAGAVTGPDGPSPVDELKRQAPRVYIDCEYCDLDFFRTEITFVNYVRDRTEADVHVLISTQRTGASGKEYTLRFIGQSAYADFQNTLTYVSPPATSQDDIRRGLTHVIKLGLAALAARTPVGSRIEVNFKEKVKETAVIDPWKSWVFSLNMNGNFSGEKMSNSYFLSGGLSANRVTPESKLRLGVNASKNYSSFEYEGEKISSSSESRSASGLYVKSLGQHWSVGVQANVNSSTYSNLELGMRPSLAVEYNFFPYSQSTRRQLRLLYTLGYTYQRYREETIYDKMSNHLADEELELSLDLCERWGTISTSLEVSHYFHDFSKNRLELWSELSLRIWKGLSLDFFGGYTRVHDQLSLPKGGASLEEILLRRRELATTYSYYGYIGISYRFGSIYSNVVNPRFGN